MTIRLRSLAVALLLPCALLAQDRQLTWPSISVTAHLDSSGALTIRERQTIRFFGDWNGAERSFDLRRGQSLRVLGMARIDSASGAVVPMRENDDLEAIDDFATLDGGTLIRWRARLPSDPAFNNALRTYELEVAFRDILVPRSDGTFQLDHNFVMVDRDGIIDDFTLTLTLDSAWVAPAGFTGHFAPGAVQPHNGYVVNIPLRYRGAGRPALVRYGADGSTRQALAAVLAAALLAFLIHLIIRERGLGRFAAVPDRSEITRAWLEHNVLSRLPEVVGAMWDDHTSSAEVAAVLARMVQEGKLTNRVETTKVLWVDKQELHLELMVDRKTLPPHERALIDGLFSSGSRTTSTSEVRERYKSSGFDPASTIRRPLETMVAAAAPGGSKPNWKPTGLLLLAGLVTIGIGLARTPADVPTVMATLGLSIPAFIVAVIFAGVVQKSLGSLYIALACFVVVVAAMFGTFVTIHLLQPIDALSAIPLTGLVLWMLGLARSLFNTAQSRQSPERIAIRKRLFAARRFFRDELRNERPALEDAWFPYAIAFGLGRHADRWFKAFGAVGQASHSVLVGSDARGGSSSGGTGWTGFGGGGGFSGGGSSASFAAAVGGMAASVPSPSSSSSGGGSSSSGGSSGGGGGGGW